MISLRRRAERTHILRVQTTPSVPTQSPRKEAPSFGKFAEDFMASYAKANNKPSEQTSKASILKTHLLPALDRVPLDRIGVPDIERLEATLLEKVSRKRVNDVVNVVSKILKYAHELEVIERVPRIKTLKVAPTKFDFFTYEELDQLVDAAGQEREWQAAILVAGDAGLRMGEILALQWDDLDLKTGTMTVMRTDWRGQVGAPKVGRARKIPLTPRAVAALKTLRHLRSKLVFCWEDGRRWTFVTMRAGIKRQEKRAGLRVNGLARAPSHLLLAPRDEGSAPRAIQELAGHQSITVTNRVTCTSRPGSYATRSRFSIALDSLANRWPTERKTNLTTCYIWVSDGVETAKGAWRSLKGYANLHAKRPIRQSFPVAATLPHLEPS